MATSSSAADLLRRSATAHSGTVSIVRSLGLLLAFALKLAGSASGQDVHGRVMDLTSEQPIAAALVILIGADNVVRSAVTSDAAGAFVLQSSDTDSVRVRVQRAGYAAVESVTLALDRSKPLQLEIRLRPQVVELEGVTVTAPRTADHERFLRRQRMGFGRYLGPEDIARIDPKQTSTLLWGMPGGGLTPGRSGRGIMAGGDRNRPCPSVYVDDLIVPAHQSRHPPDSYIPIDSYVPAKWIRAVEYYPNGLNAPPEYQRAFMTGCPIVLIWTAHSFGEFR